MISEARLRTILVGAFFSLLALIGALTFRQYGQHNDYAENRRLGHAAMAYLTTGERQPFMFEWEHGKNHGPLIQLSLFALETITKTRDSRDQVLLEHAAVFALFFVGVWYFYRMALLLWGSRLLALLGAAMLVSSPRIYADAFYNSMDIGCMVFFIVAVYALLRHLNHPSGQRALAAGLAAGMLVGTRNFGLLVPALGVLLLASRRDRPAMAYYAFFSAAFIVLLWPYLWENPLALFSSFRATVHNPWDGEMLYQGHLIKGSALPWHYNLTWISLTTPPVYLLLGALGTAGALVALARRPAETLRKQQPLLLVLAWLIIPLVMPVVFHSAMFDGWRHHYFVYPALVLMALSAVRLLTTAGRGRRFTRFALAMVLAVTLGHTALIMARLHPYQNVYFNRLAGASLDGLRQRFDMDYWALAYRAALEHIVKNDTRPLIRIATSGIYTTDPFAVVARKDRPRLQHAATAGEADYYCVNFRGRPPVVPAQAHEWYAVRAGDATLLVVYALPAPS